MRAMADETILLTYDETRILLYSLGFTSCEGIHMPEKDFSEQDVLQAMHRLAGRGLLLVENEEAASFVMRPEIRQMMLAMGSPAGSFIYRPGESLPGFREEYYNGPEYYCYVLPDYYLVTERDWTRRESLRLRAMDTQAFSDWRREREQEALEENRASERDETVTGPEAPDRSGESLEETPEEKKVSPGDAPAAGGEARDDAGEALSAIL